MELKCKFSNRGWNQTKVIFFYGCQVPEASIRKPGTEIKAFIGEHEQGKTNIDVKMIWFENTAITEFLPRNLHKIFPNLKALIIGNCGLKKIDRRDLTGLENLEILWIYKNQLRTLPSDLFKGMTKLNNIHFFGNEFDCLSSEVLEPISRNQLERVSFRSNTINAHYQPEVEGSVASLQELMEIIDKNCDLPFGRGEKKEFDQACIATLENLWTSGQYSDLIVIGGANYSKEFRVHKTVLAAQSRVLALSFPAADDVMKITDFSSDTVEQLLRFMYTGKLKKWNAIEVYAIAAKYDVKLLKERTEKIIVDNVNESNAIEVFGLGYLHNSDVMKRAAFGEIEKMFPDRMLDYELIENPEDLKQLIEAHCKFLEAEAELDSTLKNFEKVIE
jgi:Leucine-rich repeat (LRR) protein